MSDSDRQVLVYFLLSVCINFALYFVCVYSDCSDRYHFIYFRMSNRAKKMVALALNIELREKNANIKSENKAVRAKKDDDPEYSIMVIVL